MAFCSGKNLKDVCYRELLVHNFHSWESSSCIYWVNEFCPGTTLRSCTVLRSCSKTISHKLQFEVDLNVQLIFLALGCFIWLRLTIGFNHWTYTFFGVLLSWIYIWNIHPSHLWGAFAQIFIYANTPIIFFFCFLILTLTNTNVSLSGLTKILRSTRS